MNIHDIELPPLFLPGASGGYTKEELQLYTREAFKVYLQGGNAKQRYDEIMKDDTEELDPIEDLRFFCSLAMRQQDWLDVEPFFDALIADRKRIAELEAELQELQRQWVEHDTLGCPTAKTGIYASEADRQRRGEPVLVGWIVSTTSKGMLPASRYTESEARRAGYSLPVYRLTSSQTAEPSRGEPVGEVKGIRATSHGSEPLVIWNWPPQSGLSPCPLPVGTKLYTSPQPTEPSRGEPTAAEISDVIREITGCPDIKNGEDSLVVALGILFHRCATSQHAEPVYTPSTSTDLGDPIETAIKRFELLAANRNHGAVDPLVGAMELRAYKDSLALQPAEPCVSSVSDKTACGSANWDGDSQPAEPETCPLFEDVERQNAEPVKVPGDAELSQTLKEVLHSSPYGVHQWELWLEFASALFNRYSQYNNE